MDCDAEASDVIGCPGFSRFSLEAQTKMRTAAVSQPRIDLFRDRR